MKKQHGSGLIFAVVLLFVILGMVITLASVTMLETKMNQKTKSSVGAFYNSESGVEWALNQIAIKNGTDPISSIASCPFDCKVLFLGADGKVLDPAIAANTIADVKAVRSVGTQGDDTQRAIEAAVAATSNYSYNYYCYSSPSYGTPVCTDSHDAQQGYCPSGYTQKANLGDWGYCEIAFRVAM